MKKKWFFSPAICMALLATVLIVGCSKTNSDEAVASPEQQGNAMTTELTGPLEVTGPLVFPGNWTHEEIDGVELKIHVPDGETMEVTSLQGENVSLSGGQMYVGYCKCPLTQFTCQYGIDCHPNPITSPSCVVWCIPVEGDICSTVNQGESCTMVLIPVPV